jgi:antitoxin VapB
MSKSPAARRVPRADTAKVFRTGGSQAVRLPRAFRLVSDVVSVRKVGTSVVLTPIATSYDDAFRRMVTAEPDPLFERPAQGRAEKRTRIR